MKRIGIILAIIAGGIALLLVLALLGILALPNLANLEPVKEHIIERVSRELSAELTYQSADIVFLPRPCVSVSGVGLNRSGRVKGTLAELKVYPRLLPLLNGQIQLGSISLERPRLDLTVGATDPFHDPAAVPLPGDFRRALAAVLAHPAVLSPGVSLRLQQGRLDIIRDARPLISIDAIAAQIHRRADRIEFSFSCTSENWRRLSLTGRLQPKELSFLGFGRIEEFRPHRLTNVFYPKLGIRPTDSRMDMDFTAASERPDHWRVEIRARHPFVRLARDGTDLTVNGNALDVTVETEADRTAVRVAALRLTDPQLSASASLNVDRRSPSISANVSGQNVDVAALRRAALFLAGDVDTVEAIFAVVTGGTVPAIEVSASGRTIDDFGRLESYRLEGRMAEGRIHIPEAVLDLTGVHGQVAMVDGVLSGTQLRARLGNSTGTNGRMSLKLNAEPMPFHLEIDTNADVAQLHPVLLRLVANDGFRNELLRIQRVNGRASGRLILGEDLESLAVTAVVASAELKAVYGRIPFPVVVSGGTYRIGQSDCAIREVTARVGRSTLRGLSLDFDWGPQPRLSLKARSSDIALPDLAAWLADIDPSQRFFPALEVRTGKAALARLEFSGPAEDWRRWRFAVSGTVDELQLAAPRLSDPITVKRGRFDLNRFERPHASLVVSGADLHWAGNAFKLEGLAKVASGIIEVNADLSTDRLIWEALRRQVRATPAEPATIRQSPVDRVTVRGLVNVSAQRFAIAAFDLQPLKAAVYLNGKDVLVDIQRADLCGISLPGMVNITPPHVHLSIAPTGGGDLAPSLACLGGDDGVVTGDYRLGGRLHADLGDAALLSSLRGHIDFQAWSGRIHRYGILAKILALLNITEVFKGKFPDVVQDGFAYDSIRARGSFRDGKFKLQEGVIDGAALTAVYRGSIDLVRENLDLTVLVAPFKTFDSIIETIPLVGDAFGHHLISVPFAVRGPWKDYQIRPLAVTETDTGILGIVNKILQSPSRLFQPLPAGRQQPNLPGLMDQIHR